MDACLRLPTPQAGFGAASPRTSAPAYPRPGTSGNSAASPRGLFDSSEVIGNAQLNSLTVEERALEHDVIRAYSMPEQVSVEPATFIHE